MKFSAQNWNVLFFTFSHRNSHCNYWHLEQLESLIFINLLFGIFLISIPNNKYGESGGLIEATICFWLTLISNPLTGKTSKHKQAHEYWIGYWWNLKKNWTTFGPALNYFSCLWWPWSLEPPLNLPLSKVICHKCVCGIIFVVVTLYYIFDNN